MMSYIAMSGRVTNLKVSREYDQVLRHPTENTAVRTVALSAACIGELLGAAIMGGADGSTEIEMEYFSCDVAAEHIVGKLMKVGFCEGELIEFVVQRQARQLVALAARCPARRIAWMPPNSTRGNEAQLRHDIKWSLVWSICGAVAAALFDYFLIGPHKNAPLWYFAGLYGGIFTATLLINISMRVKVYPQSRIATQILATFGYKNPKAVDLNQIHSSLTHDFRRQPDGTFPRLLELGAFRY